MEPLLGRGRHLGALHGGALPHGSGPEFEGRCAWEVGGAVADPRPSVASPQVYTYRCPGPLCAAVPCGALAPHPGTLLLRDINEIYRRECQIERETRISSTAEIFATPIVQGFMIYDKRHVVFAGSVTGYGKVLT